MSFFILMAIYGVVVLILETTFLSGWPSDMLRFDLMLMAVAALAFYQEWRRAVPVILFFGVIMDVASGAPFGISVLSYLLIYGFFRAIISKISFQAGMGLLFWVATMSLLDKLICILVFLASTGELVLPRIIVRRAPAQALLDAVIGLGMVPFLKWYWDLSWEKLAKPKGLVLK